MLIFFFYILLGKLTWSIIAHMVISSQIKQFVEHLSQKSDAIFESGSKDSLTKHNNSKKKKNVKGFVYEATISQHCSDFAS